LLEDVVHPIVEHSGSNSPNPDSVSSSSFENESDLTDINVDLPEEYSNDKQTLHSVAHNIVKKQRGRRVALDYDGPIHNIVLLIVGCWLLRVPIMYIDVIRAIEQHRIPYLDPFSHVTPQMAELMNKYVRMMLAPRWAPRAAVLHSHASRFAKLLHSNYAISIPEYNFAPLLWRHVSHLHAPGIVYEQSKSLAGVLDIPLMLHYDLSATLEKGRPHDPVRHEGDNEAPELSLVAIVIVVLKLHYSDGKVKRSPLLVDPGDHSKALRMETSPGRQAHDDLYSRNPSHGVLDMTDAEMDHYLDFCRSALASEGNEFESIRHLFCDNLDESTLLSQTEGVHIESDSDAGANTEWSQMVLRTASRYVGWPEEMLVSSIERYERRLLRWWKRNRRRSVFGDVHFHVV